MNKERKIILIIGAILIAAGLCYRFFPLISKNFASENQIAHRKEKIQKLSRMNTRIGMLEKQLLSANKALSRSEYCLIDEKIPSLAAARLQKNLTDIAENCGIEILSKQVLQNTRTIIKKDEGPEGFYEIVPVKIYFKAGIRQLKKMMYRMENHRKFIRISNIRIRTQSVRYKGEVKVNMSVEGMIKKETTG